MARNAPLGFAWATVALFLLFGKTMLAEPISIVTATVLFLWLFVAMVWAAFRAINVADTLAEMLGEPLGSIVLTLTIICFEGMLVAVAMLTSDSGETMGRDTLFGANMIMINFAGGLALFLGGWRHREQTHNFHGTSAFLAVVTTQSVLGFILPNFTHATPRGSLTNLQSAGLIIATLVMYFTLLLVQIGRHKHYFDEPREPGEAREPGIADAANNEPAPKPEMSVVGKLTLILIASVVPILLMGSYLTVLLDYGTEKLGAPPALGGIILAVIVISPKLVSAVKAGYENQPQRSVNLALGSCAPAMGIIFPIILGVGVATGKTVIMGAEPADVVMLALTLILSALTFSGTHTTLLEGITHLAVFFFYILLMFSP